MEKRTFIDVTERAMHLYKIDTGLSYVYIYIEKIYIYAKETYACLTGTSQDLYLCTKDIERDIYLGKSDLYLSKRDLCIPNRDHKTCIYVQKTLKETYI